MKAVTSEKPISILTWCFAGYKACLLFGEEIFDFQSPSDSRGISERTRGISELSMELSVG